MSGPASRGSTDEPEPGAPIAEQVLGLIRRHSTAAEAEVVVRSGRSALTRFANGIIHQNVATDVAQVSLRVAIDGRVAAAGLDGPAASERLEALVGGLLEALAVSPLDPDWPGVIGPTETLEVDHWDEETASAAPEGRTGRVADFIAAADGLVTAGALSTEVASIAFASSAGHAVWGRGTVAQLDGIARTPTSDGVARVSSVALRDIDAGAAGRTAADKARRGADAADLPPGRYEVVLEPSCVADLLGFLVAYGFSGRAVEEERSFVRLGEPQLDPSVTIREDVTNPRMTGLGFDAEGTPKRPFEIVRTGVPQTILRDRRTARKAGVASTGNAALGPNPWGAVPAAIVLDPGPQPRSELIAGVERGLLVSDFWYTRVLDPRSLVVTGLTRNGVWLIEDGRIVRPVANLRFTQSYAEALGPGAVLGIGSDPSLLPDGLTDAYLVPSVRLASWNFTGGAKG